MGVLEGRTALVTGAGRGIGRGIALRLAADGARVAVHYGRSEAAAEETVALIRKDGGQAFAIGADLAEPEAVGRLFARYDERLADLGAEPGLDILVNNAAVHELGRVTDVTGEIFDRHVAVNVRAPLFLTQHALERMSEGGRVVNVSSGVTRMVYPDSVVYGMTKGALDTMTRTVAQDVGPRGITVNAVVPGFIETDINAFLRETPEGRAALAEWSVFKRIGRPDDVADVVAFLASDASRWITGQLIDVTGGSRL
ncbi:SDR family oxidoreductase [Streptomyces sp. SP18BB07]|uniref:SDR family oxidoreductase n=1 Tax=Streptomyces sp. SP18BB07 TaxID=3002522 RepID=UPI002E75F373|nr:SDR family oxidoreductase [Streptomyces sp. SP18BB07]MEE1758258.1 SDR family oxidoreductase [Streptomyces sp. SP18BB07]